jgi:hypothetical protein
MAGKSVTTINDAADSGAMKAGHDTKECVGYKERRSTNDRGSGTHPTLATVRVQRLPMKVNQ